MENQIQLNLSGEDQISNDTNISERYGSYCAYLELIKLDYTDEMIARHMSVSLEEIEAFVEEFDPAEFRTEQQI
jgi:hypothetical protein